MFPLPRTIAILVCSSCYYEGTWWWIHFSQRVFASSSSPAIVVCRFTFGGIDAHLLSAGVSLPPQLVKICPFSVSVQCFSKHFFLVPTHCFIILRRKRESARKVRLWPLPTTYINFSKLNADHTACGSSSSKLRPLFSSELCCIVE